MLTAGVDIGSVAAKAVVFDQQSRHMVGSAVIPTGWNHKDAYMQALRLASADAGVTERQIDAVTGTGYGRVSIKQDVPVLSEITCHTKGVAHLFPGASGMVDIGGQDSKAVALDQAGHVLDFVMNDKCAAGTGRFVQMVARLLELDLDDFNTAAGRGRPAQINSMCAVFAESEIIGLLARGTAPEDIAAGVCLSIAQRTAALAKRLPGGDSLVFTGGLAHFSTLARYLGEALGKSVLVPEHPQLTGALGAALLAAKTA